MAWISVHEQVIGGKLRLLAKKIGCSQNEALGMLVTLWLWGIGNADIEGKIVGASKQDIAKFLVIGASEGIDTGKAVEAMIETNWMDINGDNLYIHDWSEWQAQWYKVIASRIRDKERKRRKVAPSVEAQAKDVLLQEKELEQKEEKAEKATTQPVYSNKFEDWWKVYPRKQGKGDAYKKYLARCKDGWSPEELLEAARSYSRKVESEHIDQKYVKMPKTFLSETTPFVDYIPRKEEYEEIPIDDEYDPYEDWK